MESEVSREWECPKCATRMPAGDRFCTRCGTGVAVSADGALHAQEPQPSASLMELGVNADAKLRSARNWLLAVSILTLISGLLFFALNKQQVEREIREAESAIAGMDPADRDAALKAEIGMTWDEAVAHDRGMVNLQLAINIGLAVLYFGLWFWAAKNPLAASVTALLLFVTTIVISAVLEPKTIGQGVIVKIFFTLALAKAIAAGHEARKAGLHQP